MAGAAPTRRALVVMVWKRLLVFLVIMMLMFFGSVGSFDYWQGWTYLGVVFVPFIIVVTYLVRKDPGLLERRMSMKEKEQTQKRLVLFSVPYTLLVWMLPGFDVRFGWSEVPVGAVVAADALVFAGYLFIFRVFRENSYAARTVQVDEGQRVISTGPYALVRHPMYTGVIVMYVLSPVALGSWWAVIPAVLIVPMLIIRIRNEEELLVRELPGYAEYRERVRYRLMPGLW